MEEQYKNYPSEYPEVKNLEELLEAIQENRTPFNNPMNNVDPPTFGGEEPSDTCGIWSWDQQRMLVGDCADELKIIDREDCWLNKA